MSPKNKNRLQSYSVGPFRLDFKKFLLLIKKQPRALSLATLRAKNKQPFRIALIRVALFFFRLATLIEWLRQRTIIIQPYNVPPRHIYSNITPSLVSVLPWSSNYLISTICTTTVGPQTFCRKLPTKTECKDNLSPRKAERYAGSGMYRSGVNTAKRSHHYRHLATADGSTVRPPSKLWRLGMSPNAAWCWWRWPCCLWRCVRWSCWP